MRDGSSLIFDGYCDDVAGAWTAAGLVFLCFFFAVVLPVVAALAGAMAGAVASATETITSVKKRMADLFMQFSRGRTSESPEL